MPLNQSVRSSICAFGSLPKRSTSRWSTGSRSALLPAVQLQSLQRRRERDGIQETRDTTLKFRNAVQSAASASSRRPRRSRVSVTLLPTADQTCGYILTCVTRQAHKARRVNILMVNKVMTMAPFPILACRSLQRGYDSRDRSSASEWPTTRSYCALRGTIFQPQGPGFGAQRSHPPAIDVVYGLRGRLDEPSVHPHPSRQQSGRDDPGRLVVRAESKSNSAARQGH